MAASPVGTTRRGTRVLGGVGILGGLALLAAFVVEIPAGWAAARLLVFPAGAIAVAAATYGSHAAASPRLALAGTIPLVLANGALIAWELLALGRDQPFAGTFGLLGFWISLAFWLADAWFGLVALRLGVMWRPAALMLAAGSLLAILGIDRLGLTSSANPTVAGPLALAGIALNGLAWILLGLPVAFPRIGSLRGGAPVSADGPA
jgi:hypothetical protein